MHHIRPPKLCSHFKQHFNNMDPFSRARTPLPHSHNAPYSPPKIVHKDYFQFLLGQLPIISRRNEKQRLCKIWGANKVHYALQLCKPSTSSRVCITVSNSPNPFRVYIRLCKHGKCFLLLNYSTSACWI